MYEVKLASLYWISLKGHISIRLNNEWNLSEFQGSYLSKAKIRNFSLYHIVHYSSAHLLLESVQLTKAPEVCTHEACHLKACFCWSWDEINAWLNNNDRYDGRCFQ